jgi:hypothetical protein
MYWVRRMKMIQTRELERRPSLTPSRDRRSRSSRASVFLRIFPATFLGLWSAAPGGLVGRREAPSGSSTRGCPWCRRAGTSTSLVRVQRRFIDRLISLVRLRYRYRCQSMGCGWEGNLPPARTGGSRAQRKSP